MQSSLSLATVKSTSSLVLYFENENLTEGLFGLAPIAVSTCEPMSVPELHALPPDAEIPAISRLNNNMSAISISGNDAFNTVYKLLPGQFRH
jgi:hypothetical protein